MQTPAQIAFRHYPASDQAEEEIRARLDKLEAVYAELISASVTVDQRASNADESVPPVVRIELSLPHAAPVVVAYEPDRLQRKFQSPDLRNAINDAFNLAERQLRTFKDRRRGRPDATDHEASHQFLGQVAEIQPDKDHGFLMNKEGGLLYFHRNSVLAGDFDALKRGDEVHYVEEMGDTGPLATKVRPKAG
ncbi:HPF/RaiA family ribosome-associated protein [Mesorhizobium sp. CAU 1741]|uniref:HPF/RaiA family ribosome-associated protein n=1 Tax=Mesorhizobium sp. CAU 1741 TaxID=3140366 RepID=UPI00325A77EE